MLLSVVTESESNGGPSNDTAASAQNINAGFADLLAGASRADVIGSIANALTINGGAEDFESGVLGPNFSTRFTGSGTGAEVLTNSTGKVLWLHGDYDRETGGLVEVVWTVSLSGAGDANLSFSANHAGNDFSPFSGHFVGHYNADGVAISDNGLNWHPVLTLNDTNGRVQQYTIDLDAEAARAGMLFNGAFQI